jgi:hypothetical protein
MFLFISAKLYYLWKNKTRAEKWDSMTQREKDIYLSTTTDKGNKRYFTLISLITSMALEVGKLT